MIPYLVLRTGIPAYNSMWFIFLSSLKFIYSIYQWLVECQRRFLKSSLKLSAPRPVMVWTLCGVNIFLSWREKRFNRSVVHSPHLHSPYVLSPPQQEFSQASSFFQVSTWQLKNSVFKIIHFEEGFLKIDLFGDHLSGHQESPLLLSPAKNTHNVCFFSVCLCLGAVKFGEPLGVIECRELIDRLSKCQLPFQCAHGRWVERLQESSNPHGGGGKG